MKKIIHNVRQKPLRTRETIMWVSSITVFTLFATLWVMDFQSSTYALLNPEQVQEQQDSVLVENEGENKASPFAAILTAIGDFKDKVSGAFSSDDVAEEIRDPITLPLSK